MKYLVATFSLFLCSFVIKAQKINYEDYQREAKFNKRILPKYGLTTKSEEQLTAEEAFINKAVEENGSRKQAAVKLVEKAHNYLKNDPKNAVYHLNQAYILDSTYSNIYLGYGDLYHRFDDYEMAKHYYLEGLQKEAKNTTLLNALASNYQAAYRNEELPAYLKNSAELLRKSFKIDPTNAATSKLLTKAYLQLNKCKMAKKYYEAYRANASKGEAGENFNQLKSNCKLTD